LKDADGVFVYSPVDQHRLESVNLPQTLNNVTQSFNIVAIANICHGHDKAS